MSAGQNAMLNQLADIQWLPYYILKTYRDHLQSHKLLSSINNTETQTLTLHYKNDTHDITFEFRRQGFVIFAKRQKIQLHSRKPSVTNESAYVSVLSFRDNLLDTSQRT